LQLCTTAVDNLVDIGVEPGGSPVLMGHGTGML